MPFREEYEPVYTDLIRPAIEQANNEAEPQGSFTNYRGKDPKYVRTGWIEILDELFSSQFVLGVLSGDNPNVHYELGIAHSTQAIERQILIAEKGHVPKFDLKDLIHLEYDPVNLKSSVPILCKSILDTDRRFQLTIDRQVTRAISRLSHDELNIILQFCNKSHFDFAGNPPADQKDAVSRLCHAGLLRLNLLPGTRKGRKVIETSYYWTNMGTALMRKLDLISDSQVTERNLNFFAVFHDFTF